MSTSERVIVTGLHSGPNPSPGLGILRSLRQHSPSLRLVGLDYSPASSGLHHHLVDEVALLPPWDTLTPEVWTDAMRALMDEPGTRLISTLDLEARLLAERLAPHPALLSLPLSSFELLGKPPRRVADILGLRVCRHLPRSHPQEVESFLRSCPAGAWVKGQYYEAFRVRTAREAFGIGDFITRAWGSDWHLEEHVHGQELGIAFCAFDGRLVDAVLMRKTSLTTDGKTWSGQVRPLGASLRDRLARFTDMAGWSGGGEIELIEQWDGSLFVMEVNPRFPAWIHGATLSGFNLPASLLEQCPVRTSPAADGFTRTVEEIPVRPDLGLAEFSWGTVDAVPPSAKHPTGMRVLARRSLVPRAGGAHAEDAPPPGGTGFSLLHPMPRPRAESSTPYVEIHPAALDARLEDLRRAFTDRPIVLAYSVKTAPDPLLMKQAARSGLVGEVISTDEHEAAVRAGFAARDMILNGPAKLWPPCPSISCDALFADSVEELEALHERLATGLELEASVIGIRLAPVHGTSRFGVRLGNRTELERAAQALARLRERLRCTWGVHFHQAQSALGTARWEATATSALLVTDALAGALGHPPGTVDLGGGWHPDDLTEWPGAVDRVLDRGPQCLRDGQARVIIEPGKLLVGGTRSVVSRVLLVRPGRGTDRAAVVDASLAELPDAQYRAHPVAAWDARRQTWKPLRPGGDDVLGRTCMEDDVLARNVDLGQLEPGDLLAFPTAGGYDYSMAFPFGRGQAWGQP